MQRHGWSYSMHYQRKKLIAIQLICLEHIRWNVLVIHLCMRSSCTPAHSWHQWFGLVTIYTLFRSVWLLFICLKKICLQATFLMLFKIQGFFSWAFGMRRERENDKERNCACVHASCIYAFLLWIIWKMASDRLIGVGKWRMETVPVVFWLRLIFHHLLSSIPAPNEISCVSQKSNQQSGNCLRALGWKMHLRKLFFFFAHSICLLQKFNLSFMKQVFEQTQKFNHHLQDKTNQVLFFFKHKEKPFQKDLAQVLSWATFHSRGFWCCSVHT